MLDHAFYFLFQGQNFCLLATPSSRHQALYAAFVCGLDLPPGATKEIFVNAGLIHILVVSGSHLLFAEQLLKKVSSRWVGVGLTAYCWLTGWGAPALRALTRRFAAALLADWGWSHL